MTNNLKSTFDYIRAEEALKSKTLLYLQKEIKKQNQPRTRTIAGWFAYAAASVAVIVFTGMFSYNLYFTPSAYIDVDVNPSVELTLNRFNRVLDTHAYNSDGDDILAETDIIHKDYRDAIEILFDVMIQKGFSWEDSFISVTLSAGDGEKERTMLSNIESAVHQHHGTVNIDTLSVDSHVRDTAYELGLSPAKYLAIQELIEVDPNATIESCRGHTIGEINKLTEEHSNNHHNAPAEPNTTGSYNEPNSQRDCDYEIQDHQDNDGTDINDDSNTDIENDKSENHGSQGNSDDDSNTRHEGSNGHGRNGSGHD